MPRGQEPEGAADYERDRDGERRDRPVDAQRLVLEERTAPGLGVGQVEPQPAEEEVRKRKAEAGRRERQAGAFGHQLACEATGARANRAAHRDLPRAGHRLQEQERRRVHREHEHQHEDGAEQREHEGPELARGVVSDRDELHAVARGAARVALLQRPGERIGTFLGLRERDAASETANRCEEPVLAELALRELVGIERQEVVDGPGEHRELPRHHASHEQLAALVRDPVALPDLVTDDLTTGLEAAAPVRVLQEDGRFPRPEDAPEARAHARDLKERRRDQGGLRRLGVRIRIGRREAVRTSQVGGVVERNGGEPLEQAGLVSPLHEVRPCQRARLPRLLDADPESRVRVPEPHQSIEVPVGYRVEYHGIENPEDRRGDGDGQRDRRQNRHAQAAIATRLAPREAHVGSEFAQKPSRADIAALFLHAFGRSELQSRPPQRLGSREPLAGERLRAKLEVQPNLVVEILNRQVEG